MRIKQKVDTAANWSLHNPILLNREIGFESDTGNCKIGDGNTTWNNLPYYHNIQNSAAIGSLNQLFDGTNTFDFTDKNPKATELDSSLTGNINKGASGEYASSFGGKSAAMGKRSHAEGTTTIAKGNYSHAEGDNSVSLGNDSHAEGYQTVSKGLASHSEGSATQALGDYSHSENASTIAQGQYTHAEGNTTKAIGVASHTEGNETITRSNYSHAEGTSSKTGTIASNVVSIDLTNKIITVQNASEFDTNHYYSIFKKDNTFSFDVGKITNISGNKITVDTLNTKDIKYIFIGKVISTQGTSSGSETTPSIPNSDNSDVILATSAHAEGHETLSVGNYSHAEGYKSAAYGNCSHSEGFLTSSQGENSHAEGNTTKAIGVASHTEGLNTEALGSQSHTEGQDTKAQGGNSHAEGYYTTAHGIASHAEGGNTIAQGDRAHSEGTMTKAIGNASHAEGSYTEAIGVYSHAEGSNNHAYGETSHVEGSTNVASGVDSHAEGSSNKVAHKAAHVEGYGNITSSDFQHIQGKYSKKENSSNYIHIVGNGISDAERSNAHTLDWNGNSWYAGDIKIGGSGYDDEKAKLVMSYDGEKTLNELSNDETLKKKGIIYKINTGSNVVSGEIRVYSYKNDSPTDTGTYTISTETPKYTIKYSAVNYSDPSNYPDLKKLIAACDEGYTISYKVPISIGPKIWAGTAVLSGRNGPTLILNNKLDPTVEGEVTTGTTVTIIAVYKSIFANNGDYAMWNGTDWNVFSQAIKPIDNLTSTDKNKSLSANQGKVLNNKVTRLNNITVKTEGDQQISGYKYFS